MNLPWEAQLALAAAIGLLVGLLIMWLFTRRNGQQKKEHEALLHRFSEYKQEVDRHFVDTAAAVDEMNRSYQKVIQHLSTGAQSLMGKEALQEQLAKRSGKAVTVGYLAANVAAVSAAETAPVHHEADPLPETTPVAPAYPAAPEEQEPVSDAPVITEPATFEPEATAPLPAEAATDADDIQPGKR